MNSFIRAESAAHKPHRHLSISYVIFFAAAAAAVAAAVTILRRPDVGAIPKMFDSINFPFISMPRINEIIHAEGLFNRASSRCR